MEDRFVIQLVHHRANVVRFAHTDRAWKPVVTRSVEMGVPIMPQLAKDVEDLSAGLGESISAWFPGGMTARLVIPSTWCLVHPVQSIASTCGSDDWRFAFEQFLPIELERMTLDLATLDERLSLGVAAFVEPLQYLFEEWEKRQIFIESVYVDGCLCVHGTTIRNGHELPQIALRDDARITSVGAGLFSTEPIQLSTRLLGERHARSGDALDSLRQSQSNSSTDTSDCADRAIDLLAPPSNAEASGDADCGIVSIDNSWTVSTILESAVEDSITPDLRCGRLAFAGRVERVWDQACRAGLLLVVLLSTLSFQSWLQARDYYDASESLRNACATAYAMVHPEQTMPPAAALRLHSQRLELEATTQGVPDLTGGVNSGGLTLLRTLGTVIEAVPSQLKVAVGEIQADIGRVRLSGATTGHQQVGDIVQSINKQQTLQADPPRTKLRKDGTVEFSIVVRQD